MSLTSYRTAPPRVKSGPFWPAAELHIVLCDKNLKGLEPRFPILRRKKSHRRRGGQTREFGGTGRREALAHVAPALARRRAPSTVTRSPSRCATLRGGGSPWLLHLGADHGVPLLGDDLLRLAL